jgi:hypothetical protein
MIRCFERKERTSGLTNLIRCFFQTSASTEQRTRDLKSWDDEDMIKATVSDITSHFSEKPVLHFPYSNHYVFDYIYVYILGLYRILNKERRMIFWYKKLRRIVLTYQKLCKQKRCSPQSPPLLCIFRAVALHMCFYYQPLHNTSFLLHVSAN